MIFSVDPGSKASAWMRYDGVKPIGFGKWENFELLQHLRHAEPDSSLLVVESMVSYGMTVGDDVFSTCMYIGRLLEAWDHRGGDWKILKRPEIKMHVCHAVRATDKDIREALIQRWGGVDKAIGGTKCLTCKGRGSTKKAPCVFCASTGYATPVGPLHGIASDCWSALAIAVTASDTRIVRVEEAKGIR